MGAVQIVPDFVQPHRQLTQHQIELRILLAIALLLPERGDPIGHLLGAERIEYASGE